MDTAKRMKIMSQEKMSKELLRIGLPTMIGMMVLSLYNIVDTFSSSTPIRRRGTSCDGDCK